MKAILSFPFTYPSLNRILSMGHWERRKIQKSYQKAWVASLNLAKPWPKFTGPVSIKVILFFKIGRRRDLSNYSPKWLVDLFVECGIIKDDSKKYLPAQPDIAIIDNTKEEKTIVEIEEVK